jgi:hypothetical protein
MKINMFALLTSLVCLAACGGSSGGGNTAPTPTVQGITVSSSSDLIFIGASETFTATASMSNGGSQPISSGASWGSDATGVATADSSGKVTGVGSGMATIFVDYQGRRGTKLIRGLPNYQGAWSGSYAITNCSQTGDFSRINFCSSFGVNRVLPTNLTLTQDRDRVQGRFFLGTLGGDATGPVQGNGQLLLTGAVQDPAATIETSWSVTSLTSGRINGSLSFIWRSPGLTGDARVNADIRDLNRTSGITRSIAGSLPSGHTVTDLLSALAAR